MTQSNLTEEEAADQAALMKALAGLIAILYMTLLLAACAAPKNPSPDQERWDARYKTDDYVYGTEPVDFLKENIGLLPGGRALDLATGEGRNAVFLAEKGYTVYAVDISPVGLKKARALAAERGVEIRTIAADLESYDLGADLYDVITNFYYLQRNLTPRIKKALKPGGVVIYETYTFENLDVPGAHGPRNKEYLLEPGELRKMFADFEIVHYSETRNKEKAVASLIARKPRAQ